LLSVTYQLLGGRALTTPPVPPGEATGALSAEILSFQIRSTANTVTWLPVKNVVMEPGMSMVVIGDYSAPSLAIMIPVGPVQIVGLTKNLPA